MAAVGWKVAILDLDEPSAKEAADEVAERQQAQTVGLGCDVTDEGSVEAALAALDGSMPPVKALINNAGITSPTRFLDVTGEEWDRIFAANVRGSYNLTRRVAPVMASVASFSCRRSQPSAAAASSAPSLFGSEGRRARVRPRAGRTVGAEWRGG
jgi:NAD(P)-dependent dehydrogenase (short-subunit alcohol dehydrogenase family)